MFRRRWKRFRRGRGRRGGSRRTTARRLTKRVRRLERGIEVKRNDFINAGVAITAAGVVHGIGYPTRGVTDNQRIGEEYFVKKLHLNFTLTILQGATSDNYNRIRVIIGRTKIPNGIGFPLIQEILDTTASGGNFITAPRTWVGRQSYRILYDKVHFIVNVQDVLGTSIGYIKFVQRMLHFKINKKVRCSNNTGAPTDIVTNLYWVMLGSDSLAPIDPSWNAMWRITFTDS